MNTSLAEEAVAAAERKAPNSTALVVLWLCQATLLSMTELEILAGNGCGPGAMKIARGMFESALFARYLAKHPKEIPDYIEYLHVILWGRYEDAQKWVRGGSPEEAKERASLVIAGIDPQVRQEMEAEAAANPGGDYAKEVEDAYKQSKLRFSNAGGKARNRLFRMILRIFIWWRVEGHGARVRSRWHRKSIAQMAKQMGWSEVYRLLYSQAASIHHANIEGLVAQLSATPGGPFVVRMAPAVWIRQGLVFGLWCAIEALDTLNGHYKLGFADRIRAARVRFGEACVEPARMNLQGSADAAQ